ncbi:Glutamate decarboxylase 2 [Coniosporium tulheliwenetii]|uniref:Glutamate decarboxylase 2 n=1 Tax=Coniosporium tulheliwenetii TaxID=3383036 RepID=A0ACC2ZHZ0_9PEZI|nr:Glutamate decarboxylase 2 [Cladosporium sp. JES 115]
MASNSLPDRSATTSDPPLNRADDVSELLDAIKELIVPFIRAADEDAAALQAGHGLVVKGGGPRTALVEHHPPHKLGPLLDLSLPDEGRGRDGLLETFSVNTWTQGFMDKLYSSTDAVGLASELLLAALNTNVHVYQVSPALTLIEKHTTRALASLYGFTGPHAGGISQPGGSASNSTAIVIARNTLYPETKQDGLGGRKFVLFTSAHGHYSVEKAAQMFGFGSSAVKAVAVDEDGRVDAAALEAAVSKAKEEGETPFFVNATAGTTVLGSFDPIDKLADVCQRDGLWLHVDGCWGGPVVFNESLKKDRLRGVERADSVAVTPHKMLGVPMTCSFLVGPDIRKFWKANTLPAGYLFHNVEDSVQDRPGVDGDSSGGSGSAEEVFDLADLTPQCGRRGDALKFFLSWTFYGSAGYSGMLERAFDSAAYLFDLLDSHKDFVLVSRAPLPCCQVCFYYAPEGKLDERDAENSRRTQEIARRLVRRGFMVDYAPGDKGSF